MKGGEKFSRPEKGHAPLFERGVQVEFTLSPDEEKDLEEQHGALLRDRFAVTALIGAHIGLDGTIGVYEVIVEAMHPATSGDENRRDFAVKVLRRPRKVE